MGGSEVGRGAGTAEAASTPRSKISSPQSRYILRFSDYTQVHTHTGQDKLGSALIFTQVCFSQVSSSKVDGTQ